MQIDHDPNEKRRKVSGITVLVTSIAIGGGLALSRADWDALAASDENLFLVAVTLAAFLAVVFAVSWLIVKAWDQIWARITGKARR